MFIKKILTKKINHLYLHPCKWALILMKNNNLQDKTPCGSHFLIP